MRKVVLFILLFLPLVPTVYGQKNELSAYLQLGDNAIHKFYGGFTGFYTRSFTDRLKVTGGLNLSTKNPQAFGGLSAEGVYRFPVKKFNVYVSNKIVYNYYGSSNMNELLYRIAGTWESRYFNFTLGNSFLGYFSGGSSVFEAITLTVGTSIHLKPKEHWWNAGLFIRNYDDFIYENYNIMYGIDGRIDLADDWRLLGGLTVRPAGSMNQLAMKYETFFKIGATYKW